jgi:anti-repressor protein
MNELKIFENTEFGQVRTVTIDNEPWFVGKDVADALGYSDTNKAVAMHVEEEDKKLNDKSSSSFGQRGATLINESGLYALIFGSKLEAAKRFKRWVTSEVLPAIRKHGAYAVDELLNNPDMAIKAFTALNEEREKNKALQADNARMKPKEIFADAVATSKQSILIGELAKILKQNGYETGEKRLFTYLRDNGYLIRRKGTGAWKWDYSR